jgi:hypothetical protein
VALGSAAAGGFAADAPRRGRTRGKSLLADGLTAFDADAVPARLLTFDRSLDVGQCRDGLVEQGLGLGAFETDRRALRVVLVVTGRGGRGGDDVGELTPQCGDPVGRRASRRLEASQSSPRSRRSFATWPVALTLY